MLISSGLELKNGINTESENEGRVWGKTLTITILSPLNILYYYICNFY